MNQSTFSDDFFQTSSALDNSQRKQEKSQNKNGKPINLPSKILAIAADPFKRDSIYIAESAGILRKVSLETRETVAIYKGPAAPLTSICFSTDATTIFAGCWDKTIWTWDVKSRAPKRRYSGHNDFVKSITCAISGDREILISGGSDMDMILWNTADGRILHVLNNHVRGVQDLIVDPMTLEEGEHLPTIFSAGSDRAILPFALAADGKSSKVSEPIIEHQTSVYKLFFDDDGDLWTASADKTARCLDRESGWKTNLSLEHPDFVKDVVVDERRGWVITACRDEEIRIWNRASGELYHTYTGHFEEVTGLLLLGSKVVSVSIDATIRQWSLEADELRCAKTEREEGISRDTVVEQAPESKLTAEEERELDELLNDD